MAAAPPVAAPAPPAPAPPAPDPAVSPVLPRWRTWALFGSLTLAYFVIGTVLVLRYNIFEPDAPNRVANAGFALFTRDPHLSAIGFVWNPLPSMAEIPLVWLSQWLPSLKYAGLAGVLQSAAFMAAAALLVRGIALDRGLGTWWRRLAVAAFALHPMIVLYGASGMSEAAMLCCLVWCCRYLMRWCEAGAIRDLAWAGVALGVGYLARYEVLPAAIGVAVLVAAVSWLHTEPGRLRRSTVVLNVAIVLFPAVTAFLAWGVTGWIINDEFFATLSSHYGNSSQNAGRLAALAGRDAGASWPVIVARLFGMQPLVLVSVAVAVLIAALRRRITPLVPVLVFGSTLLFSVAAHHLSITFGWFRFYLAAIPMVVCVALACWGPARAAARNTAAAVLLAAALVVAVPVTTPLIVDPDIAHGQLEQSFVSMVDPHTHPPQEEPSRRRLISERLLAQWLDRQHLPDGSVLMDTFLTWGIWLSSDNPRQFVVTSDYDFAAALNRPWDHGIRYVIATNPNINVPDAINRRYPSMWDDGAGIAELVYSTVGTTADEMFRVYRVIGRPLIGLDEPGVSPGGAAAAPGRS